MQDDEIIDQDIANRSRDGGRCIDDSRLRGSRRADALGS